MSGYGIDAWCMRSIVSGRYVRGSQVVAQAAFRRLITPKGMLRGGDEEANYGFDLASFVGSVGADIATSTLGALVEAELLKDDRIAAVAVDVTAAGDTLTVAISATLEDDDDTFDLTLGVSDVSVEVLS